MRVAAAIELTTDEEVTLIRWAGGCPPEGRLAVRARIVLLAARGMKNKEIAEELGITPENVGRWRSRFAEKRLEGIRKDLPRGGRRPTKRLQAESQILRKVTQEKPHNATHWSTRTLAKELGLSQSMVHRVVKANGLALRAPGTLPPVSRGQREGGVKGGEVVPGTRGRQENPAMPSVAGTA